MSYLGEQTIGNIPIIYNYEYSTLDLAQAATWSAADVGKTFRITEETGGYYIILTSGGRFAKIDTSETVVVSTTDATETTLFTLTTSTDYVYQIEADVLASVNGGGSAAGYKRITTFKNDSGTLTIIGATTADHTAEDAAAWDCQIEASGLDIKVNVTGAAATNIDWVGYVKFKMIKNV